MDVLDKKEHMTTPQQMIDEFDEKFPQFEQYPQAFQANEPDRLKVRHFLLSSHIQLLEEMRESNPKYRISWDTADGGSEWCVQIWKINKDGTAELYESLSNKSDDGGSFDLDTLTSIDKKLAEYKGLLAREE